MKPEISTSMSDLQNTFLKKNKLLLTEACKPNTEKIGSGRLQAQGQLEIQKGALLETFNFMACELHLKSLFFSVSVTSDADINCSDFVCYFGGFTVYWRFFQDCF